MRSGIEAPLNASTGITVEDLFPLLSSQHFLIGTLDTTSPDEVASHDRAIPLEIRGAGLGEVT